MSEITLAPPGHDPAAGDPVQPVHDELPSSPSPPLDRFDRLAQGADSLGTTRSSWWPRVSNLLALAGVLITGGLALVAVGWWGAARSVHVEEQVPYLISGGIFGGVLAIVGALCLFSHWLTVSITEARAREQRAAARHEELIETLRHRSIPPVHVPVADGVPPHGAGLDPATTEPAPTDGSREGRAAVVGALADHGGSAGRGAVVGALADHGGSAGRGAVVGALADHGGSAGRGAVVGALADHGGSAGRTAASVAVDVDPVETARTPARGGPSPAKGVIDDGAAGGERTRRPLRAVPRRS